MLGGMCVFRWKFCATWLGIGKWPSNVYFSEHSLVFATGHYYGGNGQTTFALPDTRGRA